MIDRAFEAESRARAGAYGPGFEAAKARWEPSNPNVCTLESATGALLELKVTKRSFESPGPGGFGSSEYSRGSPSPRAASRPSRDSSQAPPDALPL